ncbi:MAG: type I restriction enzyme HsdR N-terminal domain-containing protein [Bacteroidota bacterium]|nr:type I restriction enzyme HsdR N-terminal domain-containing protein [Bacteroidota bacterium]
MIRLNLPEYDLKTQQSGDKLMIFDIIRKKYVALTKEEWVRQHFIHYMIQEKGFPLSLISVERGLKLLKMQKRYDIVIFNNKGEPKLIVECKSPEISVSQDAFDQAARYNMGLKVDYMIISNGIDHYCCKINYENDDYTFLDDIPEYSEIKG